MGEPRKTEGKGSINNVKNKERKIRYLQMAQAAARTRR